MSATPKAPRLIDSRPADDKVKARIARDFGKEAEGLTTKPILSLHHGLYSRYHLIIVGVFRGDQIVAQYKERRDHRVEGTKIHPLAEEWARPGKCWIPATDADLARLDPPPVGPRWLQVPKPPAMVPEDLKPEPGQLRDDMSARCANCGDWRHDGKCEF